MPSHSHNPRPQSGAALIKSELLFAEEPSSKRLTSHVQMSEVQILPSLAQCSHSTSRMRCMFRGECAIENCHFPQRPRSPDPAELSWIDFSGGAQGRQASYRVDPGPQHVQNTRSFCEIVGAFPGARAALSRRNIATYSESGPFSDRPILSDCRWL